MKLIFTKRDGKYDDLAIERALMPIETIKCPKQGIIPHDMVHYAVESTLAHRGFLTMVAKGGAASFTTTGGDADEAVERLVEDFQEEMWGGACPLLNSFRVTSLPVRRAATLQSGYRSRPSRLFAPGLVTFQRNGRPYRWMAPLRSSFEDRHGPHRRRSFRRKSDHGLGLAIAVGA